MLVQLSTGLLLPMMMMMMMMMMIHADAQPRNSQQSATAA